MLLAKGANKTIKNKYGQTAYETVSGSFTSVKNIYDGLGKMKVHNVQLVIESNCWIFSVFAFGYKYLNPGKVLRYLSQAAYPIYIIHMICLYLASLLMFH